MSRTPSLAVLLVVLASAVASAEPVAVTVEHVGFLVDAQEEPVHRTGVVFGFSLWDDEGSPSAARRVWPATSNACATNVSRGRYSVTLGGPCAPDLTTAHLPPGEERWLEVTIDGVVLSPRLRLSALPTARLAGDSLRLGGELPETFHDAALLTGQVPAAALSNSVVTLAADAPLVAARDGGAVSIALPRADAETSGYLAAEDFAALATTAHDESLFGEGTPDSPLRVAFGTTAATAVRGDDPRLSDARAPTGSAGGDLSGPFPAPAVVALAGRPLATDAPAPGQVLQWDGGRWAPVALASVTPRFADATNATPNQFYVSSSIVPSASGPARVALLGDATATIVRNGTDTGARVAKLAAGDALAIRMRAGANSDTMAWATAVWGEHASSWFVETGANIAPTWATVPADGAVLATLVQGTAMGPVQLVASDVDGVTFSLASGALPAGVTLSAAGALAGTPTATGTFAFTVRATDGASPPLSATRSFTLVVNAPAVISATHWRAVVPPGASCPHGYFDIGGSGTSEPYRAYSGAAQTSPLSGSVSFLPAGRWAVDGSDGRAYSSCREGDAVVFVFPSPQTVRSMRFVTVYNAFTGRFPSPIAVQYSTDAGATWQTLATRTTDASVATKLLSDLQ